MEHYGIVPASSTLYIPFTTHDTDGAAIAPSSAFEAADVRIYKNGSATQRSSEAGYTMTSPFDTVTGLHMLAVDLSDNTDAGFYAAGSRYSVILVPDETVDGFAVVRVLADFTIGPPAVNVSEFGGTAGTFASGRPEVNTTHAAGTAWGSGAITAASIATDAIDADAIADGAIDAGAIAADAITAAKIADGAIDAATFATGAITAAAIAADAITDAKVASDVTIASVTGAVGSVTGAVGSVTGNVGGNVTGSVGSVVGAVGSVTGNVGGNVTGTIGGFTTAAKAEIQQEADDALVANHLDHLLAVEYDPQSPPGDPGALLNELVESDNTSPNVARFTATALELAPTGSAPTAAAIADAVWEEAIADHSGTAGSTAEQLAAAGSAGDPWATALPGAYTSGQAGNIVGNNLNATVGSRATQTSVDTIDGIVDAILLDTAEIGTAGAGLTNINLPNQTMDIVGNITGNLSGSVGSVTGNVGGNVVGSIGSLATQAKADVNAEADTALSDVGVTSTVTGRIDVAVSTRLATAGYTAPLDAAGTRSAVGLATANLDTQLDALPTNAELATALAAADDAVLAAIAALNNLSAAQVNAEVVDALAVDTYAEPAAVPAATASLKDKLNWLATLARNTVTQTATTQSLKNDAGSGNIATAAVSDDGTTFQRSEWA